MNFLVKDSCDTPSWTLTLSLIPYVIVNIAFILGRFGIGSEVSVTEYTGTTAAIVATILGRKWITSSADAKVEAAKVMAIAKKEEAEIKADAVVEATKVAKEDA